MRTTRNQGQQPELPKQNIHRPPTVWGRQSQPPRRSSPIASTCDSNGPNRLEIVIAPNVFRESSMEAKTVPHSGVWEWPVLALRQPKGFVQRQRTS